MKRNYLLIGLGLVVALGLMFWRPADNPQPLTSNKTETKGSQIVYGATISGAALEYNFAAEMPKGWKVEAVSGSEAINFYDPSDLGNSNLEKSQIFIRTFRASEFLTLTTVNVLKRNESTINDRAAVRYEIEKKDGVPSFPNQPEWRNDLHIVTDIRVSSTAPSLFYVVAKNPSLSETAYQAFLSSLKFNLAPEDIAWLSPIGELKQRITKKPFGILIDPATSPVQPEKFSGYHTAVDVEYGDVEAAVVVRAIANGKVVISRTAQGYGGVFVVQHPYISNFYTLYGHIDPASLPPSGTVVTAGQEIAKLAPGYSPGSGGERKHLHFGVLRTAQLDIAGYVENKSALAGWLDPLQLFN